MRANLFFGGLLCVSFAGVVGAGCGSSSSDGNGGGDSGTKETAPPSDAAKEAMCKGGFDAAVAMFMTSPECTTCVETKCTSLAMACACDPACITIIQCQIACVGDGGMAQSCVETCLGESSNSNAVNEAEKFDLNCLNVGSPCNAACVTTSIGEAGADTGTPGDASKD
jgi:hypothetical protein